MRLRRLSGNDSGMLGVLMAIFIFMMMILIFDSVASEDSLLGDFRDNLEFHLPGPDGDWYDDIPVVSQIGNFIEGIADGLSAVFNALAQFMIMVGRLMILDVPVVTDLGIYGLAVRIPIFLGIVYVIIKAIPFT